MTVHDTIPSIQVSCNAFRLVHSMDEAFSGKIHWAFDTWQQEMKAERIQVHSGEDESGYEPEDYEFLDNPLLLSQILIESCLKEIEWQRNWQVEYVKKHFTKKQQRLDQQEHERKEALKLLDAATRRE